MPALPVRLGARDAVAQHARVAGEEVDLVAHLQRQQVLRVADAQVLQDAAGPVPLAVGQCAGGRHVQGLALGGRAAGGGGVRLARHRQAGRLGAEQVQVGHQHMGHRHVRRLRQRGLGLGQRVIEVAAQQRAGGLVVFGGLGIGAAQRVAVDVLDRHGKSFRRDWWSSSVAGSLGDAGIDRLSARCSFVSTPYRCASATMPSLSHSD